MLGAEHFLVKVLKRPHILNVSSLAHVQIYQFAQIDRLLFAIFPIEHMQH